LDMAEESNLKIDAALSYMLAELLAYLLLEQHNIPLTAAVEHDPAQLPASSTLAWTRACNSCIANWIIQRGMDVANDREKMAHCHICLGESMGSDPESVEMRRAVHFALASRLLREYVISPVMREALEDNLVCSTSTTSSSSGGSKIKQAGKAETCGTKAAGNLAGKYRSSSRVPDISRAALCQCLTACSCSAARNMAMQDEQQHACVLNSCGSQHLSRWSCSQQASRQVLLQQQGPYNAAKLPCVTVSS
jgi:hypothetical protein